MSVATVRAALVSLLSSVSGVKRVFAHAPNSLPPSDLPGVVLFTGPAEYEFAGMGRGMIQETRTYTAILYIAPVQTGIPGEVETACEPFFALVRNAVFNAPTLSGTAGVTMCRVSSDGGAGVSSLGGGTYAAIEFKITVIERVSAGV